jgi:hypothetical protein
MKIFILLAIVFTSIGAQANSYSMRSCMVLPIFDSAGNSFGFKVFEDIERYLKRKNWCEYKSSSEVISIFSKYRDKLPSYLEDPNVIKTVADRLKVGTIIRVKLGYDVDKLNLSLDVLGENGVDILFSEKTVLNKIDAYQVNTTIVNWLELFETTIPYDGRVVGVLGEQITFSFAKSKRVAIGQGFKIKRFSIKKRHPLLKKIVEWESNPVANGKVFNLSRGQGLGVVKVYTSETKVKAGDWVRLDKYDPKKVNDDKDFSKYQQHKFGKLGDFSLAFVTSSHTATTSAVTGNNKMNGFLFGVSTEVESWITRNYFVHGEFSKKIGNLEKSSGTPSSDTAGQNIGTFKLAGGFKYLPMGYFYGPQVNIYGGWAKYSYQMDESPTDGFGANSIGGIMLGMGGNIPLKKGIRIFGSGEIMPFGEFTDSDSIFGTTKSLSSLVLEIGAHYQWSSTIRILGSFEIVNNSAKFSGSNSEVSYSDTNLKAGALFSF